MDASVNSSELQSDLAGGNSPLAIDVRKSPAFHAASDMIAGALRRDPARVSSWAKELSHASTVVAYCVRGHDVSQGVAQALRAAYVDAFMRNINWESALQRLPNESGGAA